ncbi:MAG TPA: hypothetical protein VNX26_07870 [Candidatus Acidoferrum sp.]|jgi:hypothetical protein|nr:hypothetical protein [Candidatus Acidoferrum sp.]
MRKLAWTILALLVVTAAGVPAQEPVVDAPGRGPIDQEHTKWIDHAMRSISTIKPGMTRKNLFTVFTEEGGLSTRTHRRYVYKHCPYIKVDVEFSPVDDMDAGPDEDLQDRIVKISRPYLEYSIAD